MNGGGIKTRRPRIPIIVGVVVFVLLAGAAGFFFWQYVKLKNNPNAAAQETTQRIVGKVANLYELPGDEQPTVAQIQDKEKLKDQSFFQKAENGDHLLIYTNAKIALLYREKSNKLINVGPTRQGESQPAETQKP